VLVTTEDRFKEIPPGFRDMFLCAKAGHKLLCREGGKTKRGERKKGV